ncbi:MAG: MBL fold metallo-hydrolase [Gemmataceae bacterium]|nr:MBL fold metallo-hydrolase [Gemmataceae bacterium]
MLTRKYLFPRVIEMNHQAGRRLGVNVYLIDGGSEFLLLDIGWLDTVEETLELVRQMDFNLSKCVMIAASHADIDHVQGAHRAREAMRTRVGAHPKAAKALETGDGELTFATIKARKIDMPMPKCKVDVKLNEGDIIEVGDLKVEVWHTPGHTDGQLAFKMGDLLFVGDNIYKDGCVGVIDVHHGSNLEDFVDSLKRIRADDSAWLLPSHGPIFKRDNAVLDAAIARLTGYQTMADFGECAVSWPLLDEWEDDILQGRMPGR